MYQEGGEEISAVLNGQKLATLFDAKVNKRRHLYFEEACKKIHFFSIILLFTREQKIPIIYYSIQRQKKGCKEQT